MYRLHTQNLFTRISHSWTTIDQFEAWKTPVGNVCGSCSVHVACHHQVIALNSSLPRLLPQSRGHHSLTLFNTHIFANDLSSISIIPCFFWVSNLDLHLAKKATVLRQHSLFLIRTSYIFLAHAKELHRICKT